MKFRKLVGLLAVIAMVTALMAGCGGSSSDSGSDSSEEAAAVLKIGSTGPLTGGASIYGTAVKQGAEIAVAEINEQEKDFQIEFKMEDDEADGEKGVNAYNKVKDWGAQMIMGSVTTGSCIAVGAEAFNDRVFLMTPSASSADVTANKDNAFQICFTDPNQGVKAADSIKANFPDAKVGVIYNNSDAYSTGIYNAFKDQAKKNGVDVVAAETYPDDTNADYSAQLNSCKSAGADLILLPIYYTPASVIMKQAKDMNYDVTFFGVDGMDGILTLEGFDTELAEGVYLQVPFNASSEDEATQNFVKKYQEAYGELPNQFAADGYDGIYVLYNAFKAAGLKTDQSNEEICDAMIGQVTGGFSYDGLTGAGMTWNDKGEVNKTPIVVVIKDGLYENVE
ncbi:MAG: ABC transporter substrate-binding protein [Lachnospiraceae bacterium]|nr:ABC transporter substrate-binding protein [Lachnospiraceae bacterium]